MNMALSGSSSFSFNKQNIGNNSKIEGYIWPKNSGELIDDAGGKIDRMLYQQQRKDMKYKFCPDYFK